MRNINKFDKSLIENIKIEQGFILEELLHIAYVINFLSFNKTTSKVNNSSREIIKKLKYILEEIIKDFEYSCNIILDIDIDKIKNSNEVKYDNPFENISCENFYPELVHVISRKDVILEKLDFMQKKIVSIIESFPGYYPSPKESSIKDATKIHLFMETLVQEFKRSVENSFSLDTKEKKCIDADVYLYWDFLQGVRFVNKSKKLIINTDSFLPYRQSHWIILFHEVFHYMIENHQNTPSDDVDDILSVISKLLHKEIEDIEIAMYEVGLIRYSIDSNLLVDIFIDSLLTYIFGINYLLPMSIKLFALDEENFYTPNFISTRRWYVRIKSVVDFYNSKKMENNKDLVSEGEKFKDAINETLDAYKKSQISTKFVNYKIYIADSITSKIANNCIERFLKKEKTIIDKLKNNLNYTECLENKSSYVNNYQKYLDSFYNIHFYFADENNKKDKNYAEGRALCRIFADLMYFKNSNFVCKNGEAPKNFFELPVFDFQFIKIRYDALDDENLDKILNMETVYAYSYGSYSFLYIEPNIFEKNQFNKYKKKKSYLELLKKIASESEEVINNSDNIQFQLSNNNVAFFKENLSLTLYEQEEEMLNKLKELEEKPKDYCYFFIKYQLNEKDKTFNSFGDLKEFFENKITGLNNKGNFGNINIFHFISFDWYDFCTLILLKPENNINLSEFLIELKKNILINNGGKLLRTETNIFIGTNIANSVMIDVQRISFRIDSNSLGYGIEKLKKEIKFPEGWHIYACYGVMDIIVHINTNTYQQKSFQSLINDIYGVLKKGYFTDFQIIPEVSLY